MSTNTFNPLHTCSGRRSLHRSPLPTHHPLFLNNRGAAAADLTATIRTLLHSSCPHPAVAFAVSSAVSTSETATGVVSFEVLRQHLSAGDFRQADEETRRLLIVLAGEAAEKRGYVFFSEVQFIAAEDLRFLDSLWREHSGGRFGYSVQKKIWEISNRDFTKLFIKLEWMKRLEGSEVEQYNYRAFPAEFTWDVAEAAEGHLPLTNALRGTQLLGSILTHPAFDEPVEPESDREDENKPGTELMGSQGPFKPNYSF